MPSSPPGGLAAARSAHFGHSEFFTLVELDGSEVVKVGVVENAPHQEGGCLEPVRTLASLGATDIIVGGMGARPLAFFGEMGIRVFADQEFPTVGEVIEAFLQGSLAEMSDLHVCGGGAGCR